MRSRFLVSILPAVVILAFSPNVSAQSEAGQQGKEEASPAASKPAPRLPDGKPDLSGVWIQEGGGVRYFGVRTGERKDLRRESDVTAAEEAMKPAARQKYAAQLQAGKTRSVERDIFDPAIRGCAPLGLTRMIQQGRPVEIINLLPKRIFFQFEWDHWPRDVWMDGRPHPKDMPPTWMGHSTGKWDGDTLVVDTVGFNELTWLDSPGHPHSEALRVTERYTRVNYDTLEIQVIFEDPEIYTKPLVGNTMTYRLMPGGQIWEWLTCDDRIRLVLETDVCEISAGWEFEAYCNRRKKGLPTNVPSESNTPGGAY